MKKLCAIFVAILAAAVLFVAQADARALRGTPIVSNAPTGRVVQNGFGSGALPYANFMKSWGGSGSVSVNGNQLTTLLNDDGYPNGTPANNYGGSLFIPPDAYLSPMRFKWTGNLGGFFLGLNMTATSGGGFLSGATFSGTNGDVTFNVNPITTSTTSNTLSFGAMTFTVGTGLSLSPNDSIVIGQTGSTVNYIIATVTSYSGTTLVVNADMFYGSGTFTSWNIFKTPSEVNSFFWGGLASSGLSNFILCRDQDYATIAAGGDDSYFYHKFLSLLTTLNPQILRPMGETLSSGNEQQTNPIPAYDKRLTSMSYAQHKTYPSSAFAGNVTGVDVMTTGSYPNMPVSWTDKETFIFNAPANTVTVTLASPARFSFPKSVVLGEAFTLRTSGQLPPGLTPSNPFNAATYYYALDEGTTNIRVSATPGGAPIDTNTSATSTSVSISGNVLTVGGSITGTWAVGQLVAGTGITGGSVITSLGSGTGGAGTYNLSATSSVSGISATGTATQSGTHSMSLTTARIITAIGNNGSNLPRVTLLSTTGLSTNDIVQINMGNIGAMKVAVVDSTHIDLVSSWPSGAVLSCGDSTCSGVSNPGQTWSTTTGLSNISDPGGNNRSYITTSSINVGSRGAKQITGINGLPMYPPRFNVAVDPGGNNRNDGSNVCTYDSTIDALICDQDGLYAYSMPLQAQVALANKLNKHLWYDPGVMVSDAKVTSDIQYIAANLKPWLKLFFAYSNETWNGSFTQYWYLLRYGVAKGYAYNGSGPVQQSYTATGNRTREIMDVAATAWTGAGRTAPSLRRVISVQAFGSTTLFQQYLLNGSDLPGPPAFPNRPVDHADVLTYANYWNSVLINNQFFGTGAEYAQLVSAAADYASGNPALMASALTWMKNDFLGLNGTPRPTGTTDFSVNSQVSTGGTNAGIVPGWETVMASYDAARAGGGMAPLDMVAYEGGQDYRAPNSGECSNLSITPTQCTQISQLLSAFLFDQAAADMVVAAQQTFVSPTFPRIKNGSFLQMEGPNEWSLLSGNFFSRPYKLFDGAVQYNQ